MLDLYIAVALWCGEPGMGSARTPKQVDKCRADLIACIAKGAKDESSAFFTDKPRPPGIGSCFAKTNLEK